MKEFDRVRDIKTGRVGIVVDDRSVFKGKKVLEIECKKAITITTYLAGLKMKWNP